MPQVSNREREIEEAENSSAGENLPVKGGELSDGEKAIEKSENRTLNIAGKSEIQKSYLQYIYLPAIFLTVALLGGLRFDATDARFMFLKPALLCLIYAAVLIFLFFRASLIKLDGWFSENFSTAKNAANAGVLLTLFFASVQIFNSLLPERGLPFWTVAFCFFWTLWNNLFAEFDARKLIKSMAGMFALAFFVKYLILANLAAAPTESLWQRITENPTKEAFTYLLDLPRFAAATGYVQFFALVFYLLGLFFVRRETDLSIKN